ncbi:biotin-[acetyl-CoA-carboxylase] ligase [Plasmodium yoelii 17X]|uniref:Biotin--protein ligase 2 n=4 Tax=Plasmodium yoelii TaxID=5861 RepID=A0AAF0B530_PLAYO|nr:biotin--protein ligase 2, putative [Plasmodium yoelii]EAA21319.1 biotin--acetyl-CoA-carboxylase ligase [Plasmodium yoelii yoelii]ETB63127.1 biotin-[acetyl-CoA-carboxylase] ligase [Plasmodium yoelii 17X]WBY59953.1 biotin--protein ligase 2 [Plasmodium yoelii yoelii]CDU19894.1 biotin protein ligase, putative [Plasmodium yoelii]VTZ80651.1 biotin--protein ligase 2, putative [Plasmodium yoelii]|eukprot:XP_729754.1 biotin--protein ligase 2, putative [Plasmodium yoelii]
MKEEKVIYEKVYCAQNTYRYHLDELDSTQLYCKRNMKKFIENMKIKNFCNMIAVSCNLQTNGIGTKDTKQNINKLWVSEKGNLFVSFAFLWEKNKIEILKCLPQISTVAISKTLEHYNLKCQIKWINDVLINYKKIASCLINVYYIHNETKQRCCPNSCSIKNDYIYVIVGIGINIDLKDKNNLLNNNFTSIKNEINTDLMDNNIIVPSVEETTEKLIENFHDVINNFKNDGFSLFLDYITLRLIYKSKKVIIDQDNNQIIGYLKGIENDGSIILVDDNDMTIHVNNGHMCLYDQIENK